MEELATVVKYEKGLVSVVSEIKSACSGCQQADNCGSGQVAKAFPTKQLSLTLPYSSTVNVGDTVVLGISEGCITQSAWQVYLFPLIGLISFSGVGQYLVELDVLLHELIAVLFGVVGGYGGFLFAKKQQSALEKKEKLTPKILRVLKEKISIVTT